MKPMLSVMQELSKSRLTTWVITIPTITSITVLGSLTGGWNTLYGSGTNTWGSYILLLNLLVLLEPHLSI